MPTFELIELIALPDLTYDPNPTKALDRYNPFSLSASMPELLKADHGIDLDMIKTYVKAQLPTVTTLASFIDAAHKAWSLCDSKFPNPGGNKKFVLEKDAGIYKIVGSQHIGISFIQIEDSSATTPLIVDRLSVNIASGPPKVSAHVLLLQLLKKA